MDAYVNNARASSEQSLPEENDAKDRVHLATVDGVHIERQDGTTLVDPATPVVISTTHKLDAFKQQWSIKTTTWGAERDRWLDHDHWPIATVKEDSKAFCGVELLPTEKRG